VPIWHGYEGDNVRIAFQGIDSASPLGTLLQKNAAPAAKVLSNRRAGSAASSWKRVVSHTQLRWWGDDRPTHGNDETAEIYVDCFGTVDPFGSRNAEVWRIVNGAGEAILHPFCSLERCGRSPYVESIYLLRNGGDGWRILEQAHISNRRWYRHLLDDIARVAAHLVGRALRSPDRANGVDWDKPFAGASRSRINIGIGRLGAALRQASTIFYETAWDEYWAVATAESDVNALMESPILRTNRWIEPASRSNFYADPFPSPELESVVLCEKYDFRKRTGVLCALTLGNGKATSEVRLDLQGGIGHLSYPYAFQEDGRTYLLPEMAAAGKLLLFELDSSTAARPLCTVDTGTAIADPTLFRHEDRYWIAYCDQRFGSHNNLCFLFSDKLRGPWKHHPLNPVKIDIRSSRPGGTPFSINGELFRPAQDCSKTYGGAVAINRIRTCTPDAYEEETVAVLRPNPRSPFPDGLHTVSMRGNLVLFDGKRLFFRPARLLSRAKAWLRRCVS
jgi:hypothetical protein